MLALKSRNRTLMNVWQDVKQDNHVHSVPMKRLGSGPIVVS
jgi:hypothetical protein